MTKFRIRLFGLGFGLLGCTMMWWAWQDALSKGEFVGEAAFLGPFFVAFGLYIILEAPAIPVRRPSIFGWACTVVGLILGFLFAEFLRKGNLGGH